MDQVCYRVTYSQRLPWFNSKESIYQCRRHGFNPWSRKWPPTPGFLPGKSHGQRSPAVYSLWGCKTVRQDLVTEKTVTYKMGFGSVDNDLEAFAAALLTPEGPLDNFIIKLGCGSRCSEAGRAFLGQGL